MNGGQSKPKKARTPAGARSLTGNRKKASTAAVRSPAALFLHFAARNLEESRVFVSPAGHEHTPQWRLVEHRLSAILFACSAVEAHLVAIHQVFFAHRISRQEAADWRQLPILERLASLLPKRVFSARRQLLLREVLDLRERISQPPPFQVAEQIELFAPVQTRSSSDFWFGSSQGAWVKVPLDAQEEEENPPGAGLPKDPADLQDIHVVTALLILLEHAILLDRIYQNWSEWPLSVLRDKDPSPATQWFEELRESYEGPHAAYFRRLRTDLQAESEDAGDGGRH